MCETVQIAVNSVINWSFFYYICCFSIFPTNFIDSGSGMKIRIQLWIRILDTWRHRAPDHSTRHRPLPTCTYWWSFSTKPVSPAVFEILTLTFQGHVTSSVTWPFDSQVTISYWRSILTKSLNAISNHFRDNGHKKYRGRDLDLSGSRDGKRSNEHWTRDGSFPIGGRLDRSLYL